VSYRAVDEKFDDLRNGDQVVVENDEGEDVCGYKPV
jgi:hypothetical protein